MTCVCALLRVMMFAALRVPSFDGERRRIGFMRAQDAFCDLLSILREHVGIFREPGLSGRHCVGSLLHVSSLTLVTYELE